MLVYPGSTFGSVQTHFLRTPSLSCCILRWEPSDWSRMQTHHLMNLADLKAGLILSHWRTSLHIPGLSSKYNWICYPRLSDITLTHFSNYKYSCSRNTHNSVPGNILYKEIYSYTYSQKLGLYCVLDFGSTFSGVIWMLAEAMQMVV